MQHPMPLDYMFEEFLHKNIRVKPLTGKEDEGREANQSRGPGMLSQADLSEEEGDNFNKIADLEMEEQRNLIKQKIRDFVREFNSSKRTRYQKRKKEIRMEEVSTMISTCHHDLATSVLNLNHRFMDLLIDCEYY